MKKLTIFSLVMGTLITHAAMHDSTMNPIILKTILLESGAFESEVSITDYAQIIEEYELGQPTTALLDNWVEIKPNGYDFGENKKRKPTLVPRYEQQPVPTITPSQDPKK